MSVGSGIKQVKGREIASRPYVDDDQYTDEEFAVCLCGEVPAGSRIDLQVQYFSEAKKRLRWKNLLTSHADCPLHGSNPETRTCRED